MKKLLSLVLLSFIGSFSFGQSNCDYAINFPGTSSYVDCGPGSGYNAEGQLTVEAWINLISTIPNQKIAGNIDPFTNSGFMLGIENGGLYCEVKDTLGLHTFTAQTVPSGEWVHIAFTYRAGGRFRGYVNGIMVADEPATSQLIGDNGTTNFRIGVAPWDPNYFRANGLIDEVRVYNIEKSVSQIREQMRVALVGPVSGLIGYWRFSEGSGTTTVDLSGYNHTGTLTGFTLPTWQLTDGPYGSGTAGTGVGNGTFGALNFPTAGAEIVANINPTTDTFVVSRINCEPGGTPPVGANIFNNGYWIVDRYGSATPLNVALTFNFPAGTVSPSDSVLPSNLLLYNRNGFSTGTWVNTAFAGAASPSAATVTFPFISSLGQFKVGSNGSSTLAVDELQSTHFSVFPNPANQSVSIEIDGSIANDAMIYLYDSSGRMVLSQYVSECSLMRTLDLQNLPPGIYQLLLPIQSKTYSQRLMISR